MQDVSEIRLRTASIEIGFWLTVVVCLSSFVYVLLTSEQPNRGLITLVFAVALVAAFAIKAIPADVIVHSRFREAFFVTWSALDIALIGLVAGLDGGVTSPFATLWFLTLIFAGISYPFASMLAASVLNLLGFGIVAAVAGNPSLDYVWFMLASLAFACGMCAWQAHKHDVQREELARVSRSDPLTACLNRRGFEERFAAEVSDIGAPRPPVRADPAGPRPVQARQRQPWPRRRGRPPVLGRCEHDVPCFGRATPSAGSAVTSSRSSCPVRASETPSPSPTGFAQRLRHASRSPPGWRVSRPTAPTATSCYQPCGFRAVRVQARCRITYCARTARAVLGGGARAGRGRPDGRAGGALVLGRPLRGGHRTGARLVRVRACPAPHGRDAA